MASKWHQNSKEVKEFSLDPKAGWLTGLLAGWLAGLGSWLG